jgi:hypothetical protein
MAKDPARPDGRNSSLIDPSCEFEDVYDRMGQLVNVTLAGPGALRTAPCCPATSRAEGSSLSWPTGC